jgi:sulfur carrier protein
MTDAVQVQVMVNGEPVAIAARTLAAALVELAFVDVVVATAVNGDFVPVRRRLQQAIGPGDRIEIVAPMQGG